MAESPKLRSRSDIEERSYMKPLLLYIPFSLVLLLGVFQQSAHAQWILCVSSLTQDTTNHIVRGTSSTQMDYNTQLYYVVYTKGYIYNQDPNVRLDTQIAWTSGSTSTASVNTQANYTSGGVFYNLK